MVGIVAAVGVETALLAQGLGSQTTRRAQCCSLEGLHCVWARQWGLYVSW